MTTTFANIMDYGATGDGTTSDTAALLAALGAGSAGKPLTVYLPPGVYNCASAGEIFINNPNVAIVGTSAKATTLILSAGLRPIKGQFSASGIGFVCSAYSSNNRAIYVSDAYVTALNTDVTGFSITNCDFTGFFYSVDLRGGAYKTNDYTYVPQYFIRDVKITGCTSTAPASGNAGHFQMIQTYDTEISGCSTYGGAGATSYNFIQSNGFVRVTGNYSDTNSYGSCEIENQAGDVTITGNTFKSLMWVDDSSYVTVAGNRLAGGMRITCQSYNVRAVQITGNTVDWLAIQNFGDASAQNTAATLSGVCINGNVFNGTGAQAILVQDALADKIKGVSILANTFTGTYTTGVVTVVRNVGMNVTIMGNVCSTGHNYITLSGTGGTINTVNNKGATYSGTRDRMLTSYHEIQVVGGIVVTAPNGNPYLLGVSDTGSFTLTANP